MMLVLFFMDRIGESQLICYLRGKDDVFYRKCT